MTSSPISLTFWSLFTWTTSSYSQTTSTNTEGMCEGNAIDKATITRYFNIYELIRVILPGAAVILRDQAEESLSHQSQPYALLQRLLHNWRCECKWENIN